MRCFRATVTRVRTRFPKETEVTNRETVSREVFFLFFRFADPANVGKSLLDGNNYHLLNQARSDFLKQENQVGSLDSCIEELKLLFKDWNWRTPITDFLNLEEDSLDELKSSRSIDGKDFPEYGNAGRENGFCCE